MSVKKKSCRICVKDDLHANFVNIFELTVPNVAGDGDEEKISLFETMRQLTGTKVIFRFILFGCTRTYQRKCEKKITKKKIKTKTFEIWFGSDS